MSDNQSDGQRLKSAISNHTHFDGIGRVINIDAAAAEFSQPYRDRIAELEAENARLRAVFVPPGSALILIAPEVASQDEMLGAAERASKLEALTVKKRAPTCPKCGSDWCRHSVAEDLTVVCPKPDEPICLCPATSEYDPPCPRHGVLGIGVTGRS